MRSSIDIAFLSFKKKKGKLKKKIKTRFGCYLAFGEEKERTGAFLPSLRSWISIGDLLHKGIEEYLD